MTALPLVSQLQQDALDPTVRTSDLLRKTKFVAAKLSLPELMEWVDKELQGYEDNVPQYRMIVGTPMARNPYHGWYSIKFERNSTKDSFSKRFVGSSISQIEDLLSRDGDGHLTMNWPASTESYLRDAIGFDLDVTLFIDRSQLSGILDAVRNSVLDWSLKLEAAGIVGEGFTFTKKEKELAHQNPVSYQIGTIQNFSGNLGPASDNATINSNQFSNINTEIIKDTIEQIEKTIPVAGLENNEEKKAIELIAGIRQELSNPQPDGSKLKNMLGFLKKIAEGASSKIVADGIVSNIDAIF